jgi:GAF domain-containing protein
MTAQKVSPYPHTNSQDRREIRRLRRRVAQWTLWECDPSTLEKMLAEVVSERRKLDTQLQIARTEFEQLISAGDPISVEEVRSQVESLGRKWDTLHRRQRDIEAALRQRHLDDRLRRIGRAYGIDELPARLQLLRIVTIAVSIVVIALSLIPTTNPRTLNTFDTINLICSVFLTGEFALRLLLVRERFVYLRTRALDVLLSLPLVNFVLPLGANSTAVQIMRLLTLLRVGRLVRLILGESNRFRSIKFFRSVEFELLQRAAFSATVLIILGTLAIAAIEGQQNPAFGNLNDTLWWNIQTVLTGEIKADPQSFLGRLLTLGSVLVGLIVTSVLIASFTAVLVELAADDSGSSRKQEDIEDKLNAVRSKLDLLTNAKQSATLSAARIADLIANAPEDDTSLYTDVVRELVVGFGCLQASIHLISDSTRDLVRVSEFGNSSLSPDSRVPFDAGLIGRAAVGARSSNTVQRILSEPLPLADAAAFAAPLVVRRTLRKRTSLIAYAVLHVVVPQEWVRDDLIKSLLLILSSQLAGYLHDREITQSHSALLESVSDLQKTMEQVTTTRDYDRLLFAIAAGANNLLNADMSKVMLLGAESGNPNVLRGVAWHGMDDDLGRSLFSKLGEGLTGLSAQTAQPVKSSNLLTDQRVTVGSSQALRSGMRSELCVPIIARGEVLGVLSVMSRAHKRFTPEEEALLGTLASQAGAAIENAKINAIEQKRLKLAETMQEVSAALNNSLDESQTLNVILDQLANVIPYDGASILLRDGADLNGADLVVVASRRTDGADLQDGFRFPAVDNKPFTEMLRTGEAYLIDDVQANRELLYDPPETLGAWLSAPLITNGSVIGMLSLDSTTPHRFTGEDRTVVMRFAVQAALAVRNARLYRALLDART